MPIKHNKSKTSVYRLFSCQKGGNADSWVTELDPSDRHKSSKNQCPNVFASAIVSSCGPVSGKEQVVLIFHPFIVFAALGPRLLPFSIPHPTRAPQSLSSMLVVLLFSACSGSTRNNPQHHFASLHFHLAFPHLASSSSPSSSSSLSASLPLSPSAFPPFFPHRLPSFSLPSPSLVVDWVSECLWQLCVVCNRAERLVWIQRWENLFMWEMHRWRQVSRRCGLPLAVIPHSGADRRSEMAKYARHSAQIPKQHATIQPMVCLCLFRFDRMILSVCVCVSSVCMCLQGSMLDQIPLPQARSRVHYRWAIEGRKATSYSLFLSHPSDLFLLYVKAVQRGTDPASNASPLRCVSGSNSSFSVFIRLSEAHRWVAFVSVNVWGVLSTLALSLQPCVFRRLVAPFVVSPWCTAKRYSNQALQLNNLCFLVRAELQSFRRM